MYIVVPPEPKSQRKHNQKRDSVCTHCLIMRDLPGFLLDGNGILQNNGVKESKVKFDSYEQK